MATHSNTGKKTPKKTKYLNGLKKRFKNAAFLAALAGIAYNALQHFGIKIPLEDFRNIADLISYLFVGAGIYATYGEKQD